MAFSNEQEEYNRRSDARLGLGKHANVSTPRKSTDVVLELLLRVEDATEITVPEFRRLFLLGLAYLLREADSTSAKLHKMEGHLYRMSQSGGR